MIDDILYSTFACFTFQCLLSMWILVNCGKPKKRPLSTLPASDGTSQGAPVVAGTPKAQTATTQSSNVTFADTDDPKNKSTYGVDDGVFKPKKASPGGNGGAFGGKKTTKTDDKEAKAPSSAALKSKESDKKPKAKKASKESSNKKKKNDDSDKTDLRSLTLEHNLAAAKKEAKIKNPAGEARSNRLIEDVGAKSGYAPPIQKKDVAASGKNPKKNASAYL